MAIATSWTTGAVFTRMMCCSTTGAVFTRMMRWFDRPPSTDGRQCSVNTVEEFETWDNACLLFLALWPIPIEAHLT